MNPNQVIAQVKSFDDSIRTHTFGVGNGCDSTLVIDAAKAGRGSHSLIIENIDQLNSKVITALKWASEPSLKGCKLVFGEETEELNEVFRYQVIQRSALMTTK